MVYKKSGAKKEPLYLFPANVNKIHGSNKDYVTNSP